MKKDDFERLKAVCEKEGYQFAITSTDTGNDKVLVLIEKKDIWDGVEFFKGADGIIRKIPDIETFRVLPLFDRCKPSTESAYVEQLKKEALERFPNIKEGDIIKTDWDIDNVKISKGDIGFEYVKFADMLLYNCTLIYKDGKWAERVKERVKVEFADYSWEHETGKKPLVTLQFFSYPFKDVFQTGQFLASQLEKYLNGEIE